MDVFTFELGIAGAERANRKRVIVFRYLHGVLQALQDRTDPVAR